MGKRKSSTKKQNRKHDEKRHPRRPERKAWFEEFKKLKSKIKGGSKKK